MSRSRIGLPYGMRDGRLLPITEVESGLACGCTCPGCGSALVAKKGKEVVHHFAHQAAECAHGLESTLHLAAKEILNRERKMWLPAFRLARAEGSIEVRREIGRDQMVALDEVLVEKRVGQIVPDLLVKVKGKLLLIEIAVTHFVDAQKSARVRSLGLPALEIDLSDLDRLAEPERIAEAVINGRQCKKWIYTPKAEGIEEELERELRQRIDEEERLRTERAAAWQAEWNQKRLAAVEKKRLAARRRYAPQIQALMDHTEPERLAGVQRLQAEEAPNTVIWRDLEHRLGIQFDQVPEHLNVSVHGEGAFRFDRRVWQGVLFATFVFGYKRRANPPRFAISEVFSLSFSLIYDFMNPLFLTRGMLTEEEKRRLPDLTLAVRSFLYGLCDRGFIRSLGSLRYRPETFIVEHDQLMPPTSGRLDLRAPVAPRNRARDPARVLRLAEETKLKGAENYSCRTCRVQFVYPKGTPIEAVVCLGCGSPDVHKD